MRLALFVPIQFDDLCSALEMAVTAAKQRGRCWIDRNEIDGHYTVKVADDAGEFNDLPVYHQMNLEYLGGDNPELLHQINFTRGVLTMERPQWHTSRTK